MTTPTPRLRRKETPILFSNAIVTGMVKKQPMWALNG